MKHNCGAIRPTVLPTRRWQQRALGRPPAVPLRRRSAPEADLMASALVPVVRVEREGFAACLRRRMGGASRKTAMPRPVHRAPGMGAARVTPSPATWRPSVKQRSRAKVSTASTPATLDPPEEGLARSTPASGPAPAHPGHGSAIITYPFPLRQGVLASLDLPPDLMRREAQRLAAFVESLAIEDQVTERAQPPHEPTDRTRG